MFYRLFFIGLLLSLVNVVTAKSNETICINQNNVRVSILTDVDDQDIKKLTIFDNTNNRILFSINTVSSKDISSIYQFQDLDFDGKDEMLIHESVIPTNNSFHVLKIGCNDITYFYPEYITNFSLDKNEKKLNESIKEGINTINKTYCLDDHKYYLCHINETLSSYGDDTIWRVKKFNKNGEMIEQNIRQEK